METAVADQEQAITPATEDCPLPDLNGGALCADPRRDEPYFDSSTYRCCWGLFHAKVCAFVLCTWFFHEITLGTIYLLSQLDPNAEVVGDKGGANQTILLLLLCRALQIPAVALLYVALWRHRPCLLLPFAMAQCSVGAIADMGTLLMLLARWEASETHGSDALPFGGGRWYFMHWLVPSLVYTGAMLVLVRVLYKCYAFLRARREHDNKRMMEKSQLTLLSASASSSHSSLVDNRLLNDNIQLGVGGEQGMGRVRKISNNSVALSISRHSSVTNYSTRSSSFQASTLQQMECSPLIARTANAPSSSTTADGSRKDSVADNGGSSSSIESASSLLERMQLMQLIPTDAALRQRAKEVDLEMAGVMEDRADTEPGEGQT